MFHALVAARNRQVQAESWTTTHELLATVAELTHLLWATTVRANSSKPQKIEPLRIPRPGDRAEEKDTRTATPAELATMLMMGG